MENNIYMKSLELIKKPELFQGEKYFNKNINYFEGWYFKNIGNNFGISFIPGINIDENGKKAFIQVITNNASYYINYDINEFKYYSDPFYIKIKNNVFSRSGIYLDIVDESQNIKIKGTIKYSNSKNIKVTSLNPNIMGPFSYIPFMECNHAILSMKNDTHGIININDKKIEFYDGIGYIEKDWGISFPKDYIWCQGNSFLRSNASFMISLADIPFKLFHFRGFICVLIIEDKEFKFTTYNNAKIVKYIKKDNLINITLKKDDYYLNIKSENNNSTKSLKLSAPVKGKMEKDIFESINSIVTVSLRKNNNLIFSDTSKNCGLEIVN